MSIKLTITNNHPVVTDGLQNIFAAFAGMQVISTCLSGKYFSHSPVNTNH